MMRLPSCWLFAIVAVVLPAVAPAADIQPSDISRLIDEHLGTETIDSGQLINDAGFLRRVSLDLAGRIPTIAEVYESVDHDSASQRSATIRRLMNSGVYYRNMATFWRRAWVPQADTSEFAAVADKFELWVANRLQEGARYDDLVAEILTLDPAGSGTATTSPMGFYDANQSRPENLAASSTRAFLGINLDCAQCHDHPFSRWTRGQFWETAAFFAQPQSRDKMAVQLPKVRVPDTDLEYQPALLTREEITWPQPLDSRSLRLVLADWMQRDSERLLAKNAVNRLWANFFGEAIIEPMDDLSRDEFQTGERAVLLNALANAFVDSGYDLDLLVTGIVSSTAYRLSASGSTVAQHPVSILSEASEETPAGLPPLQMTNATIRALTGEQLYDSLQTASGLPPERDDVAGRSGRTSRREIASQFYVERAHNAERSISQALSLMNGSFINGLTTRQGNPMLASVLSSPFMTPQEQIDTVFIAVLGRHGRKAELQAVQQSFADHASATQEEHLGNLFWALVNSSEFNTNH